MIQSLDQPIADAMTLIESLPPLSDEHGTHLKDNLRAQCRQLRLAWLAYKAVREKPVHREENSSD